MFFQLEFLGAMLCHILSVHVRRQCLRTKVERIKKFFWGFWKVLRRIGCIFSSNLKKYSKYSKIQCQIQKSCLEFQFWLHQILAFHPIQSLFYSISKSSSTNHQFLPNCYSYPQPYLKSSMKMHRKLHFLCSIIWITCIQSCLLNICITPAFHLL